MHISVKLKFCICIDSKLRAIECPHCGAGIKVDVSRKTGKCPYCEAEFYLL